MARPGDPIILDLTLPDFDANKHVLATIKADGVAIGSSPVLVANIGGGNYFFIDENNLVFPASTFEVAVTYQVFKDALLTELSKKYGPAKDQLRLQKLPGETEIDFTPILDKIDQVRNLILTICDVEVRLAEDEGILILVDEASITAQIPTEEPTVLAKVSEEPTLTAEILVDEPVLEILIEEE